MESKCKYCKYFVQHYVQVQNEFVNAYCGHCTRDEIRHVTPEDSCSTFLLEKRKVEPKKTD